MPASVPDCFLGLPSGYADARFVVLPVPYDSTTSYATGTREGPRAILTASQQVEFFDEGLGRESTSDGVHTLEPLEVDASGPQAMVERIHAAARKPFRDDKFLVTLGGEHSISSAPVRAAAAVHKNLSVLQIDAHADLRDEYHGTPYSHACVMRRIHDLGVPAVGVGIRSYSAEEARFIRKAGKPIFSARQCQDDPDWIARALEPLSDTVYLTIDIDGFDPAFAPGTGTPEPGGLSWRQVTDLLDALTRRSRVVGCDVVEVRPIPPNHVTEFLAARLIYRIIGLVSRGGS